MLEPVKAHVALKHTPALCTHVTAAVDCVESGGADSSSVPLTIENTGDSASTVGSCSELTRTEKAALVAVEAATSHENLPADASTPDATVATGTPLRSKSRRTVPPDTSAFDASHVIESGLLFTFTLPARGAPTTRPYEGPLTAVMLTRATSVPSCSQRTTTLYAEPPARALVAAPGQLTFPAAPGRPAPTTPTTAPVAACTTDTVTVPAASALPKPTQDTAAGARRYHAAFCPGAAITSPAAGGETTVMSGEEESRVVSFTEVMRME
jgi:hypothetical protein